jgi:hypothetical protein
MASNPFDDLDQPPPPKVALGLPARAVHAGPNPFDDLPATSAPQASLGLPPVTAGDRVQAGEAGILKGAAYLGGMLPDAFANTYNLAKAGVGTAYEATTGKAPPHWLEAGDPNPVGKKISEWMDKSPITTTQIARPDDTASRYLATAGSVVPGVIAGGGGVGSVASAIPPALAGQAVAEKKPFPEDWENNAAAIGTQLLGSAAMPRARGPDVPGNEVRNQTVRDAQEAGMVFPPATTNPSTGNRVIENLGGKMQVQQHATLINRDAVNEGARADLGIGGHGGISDAEIAQIRAEAAPHYQAVRQAGPIPTGADPAFVQRVQGALDQFTGAGRVLTHSGSEALQRDVGDILSHQTSDSGDLLDTVGVLRDNAQTAFRAGNGGIGAAYRRVSDAIEDQIQNGLPPDSPILQNYRDARRRLAITHSVEDARNEGSGDVNAQRLATMLHNDVPLQGNLLTAARAAAASRKAFAPVTDSRGVNHLGLLGTIAGGAALGHEFLPSEWGLAPAAAMAGWHGARLGARAYALGPGQANAIATQRGPIDPSILIGNYLASQGRPKPPQ